MKIAFVDYVLEPDKPGRSGLSDIVWDMATELVNQGHEAHIVASYHTKKYPDPRVIVHNFATPPIGYRNLLGQLWILKRATSIVKSIKPDIVHTPEYVSTAVMATLGVTTPLILTVPGNVFERIQKGHGYERHYIALLKWAARVSARRCASVIAISKEMKRWWEWTGSAPERTPWIPYGISTQRFHPVSDARKQLGISEEKQFLLYVGRFSKEKGVPDLIEALNNLKPLLEQKNVEVMLIGKGPQYQEISNRIRADDLQQIVHIRDWVSQDELGKWYSAADVLLMPSWNEPLGRVMLEAMACGTPVIASATEGPIDHIYNGKNGYLFPPGDIPALTSIVKQVVTDRQIVSDMSNQALLYTVNNLGWDNIMKKIVDDVYNSA